jgi:hypothetical protein
VLFLPVLTSRLPPASSNNDNGRPPPTTSFAQTQNIVHVDLFVSCIRSFLLDLPLLINYQVEAIWITAGQLGENTSNMGEGAVNEVGGGDVKTRKTGRHDGKHCQTRSPATYVQLFMPFLFYSLTIYFT